MIDEDYNEHIELENEFESESTSCYESTCYVATWITFLGLVGGCASVVAKAPITAIICASISLTGLGMHITNISLKECIPRPHEN